MQNTPDVTPHEMLRAHVELSARNLPLKIWFNPAWVLVALVPFLGPFLAFGAVPLWHLTLALGLHLIASGFAAGCLVYYRRQPEALRRWRTVFLVLQAMTGLSWGALPWLLWVPGNALNHATVVIPMVAVLVSNAAAVTRWPHYLAGAAPVAGMTLLRLALGMGPAEAGLALMVTVAFIYTLVVATLAKAQHRALTAAHLANQNLTGELIRARDEALRKRHEAEAASAAKTTFLANISHELRTPLNAILGFSEIIAHEAFGPAGVSRYRDYAGDIFDSGKHLLGIIDDILDVAKIEAGRTTLAPAELDARVLIDNVLRQLMPRVREKRQHVSVRLSGATPALYADDRAFRQILLNLAANASKFTPAGGSIAISGAKSADGGFELVVADNGPGFAPDLLEDVFKPFNQVNNRYSRQEGGTGLGLSLVRGLALLHGGRAWIDTAPGAGVRAHVVFPPRRDRGAGQDEMRLIA